MPKLVNTDHKGLLSVISKSAKQVEFAGILSLTRVAVTGQKEVRKSLDKRFELKNKWTASGIRIKSATKQEPYSEVFSRDWYIAQHEEGAKRKVPETTDSFFIPGKSFEELIGIDPHKKLIPKKHKPDRILNTKIGGRKPFKTRVSGHEVIAVRRSDKSYPIGILYFLEDKPVKIKGRDWFDVPVRRAYDKNIESVYDKALVDALRTAL